MLPYQKTEQMHHQAMPGRQRREALPRRQFHHRENLRELQYVSMYVAWMAKGASRRQRGLHDRQTQRRGLPTRDRHRDGNHLHFADPAIDADKMRYPLLKSYDENTYLRHRVNAAMLILRDVRVPSRPLGMESCTESLRTHLPEIS